MDIIPRDDIAARNRFESFKLGNSLPSSPTSAGHPQKRNSHHRRRSSVSTRHESAEIMGISLPDIPVSMSEDNINLGEKDSIRRRALWALEGKPDVSFAKVEIPDNIDEPDFAKSFSQSGSAATYGTLRDSFKLLGPSSSSKDQLHTLVEEEEEDDDESHDITNPPNTPLTPALTFTKPTPVKPRPSNLNLRPLSLTPENLSSSHLPPVLPSPPSSSPSPRPALRSLSLSPSPTPSSDDSPSSQSRRVSIISPSRRPILNLALEKLEYSMSNAISNMEDDRKPRRSSISYKRSSNGSVTMNFAGLPTPEMTPTLARRRDSTSDSASADDEFFPGPHQKSRPLSASEQHFLVKSHNALLARITDLERALSMRRRESSGSFSTSPNSRPLSTVSTFSSASDLPCLSSVTASEPSDELLRLTVDLKSERDELKQDVDGWRTRVKDMESQMGVLAKRVENERRDAWVARSRVGLLEVEKEALNKKIEATDDIIALHAQEKNSWEQEKVELLNENADYKQRIAVLEVELENFKKELEKARLEAAVHDPLATPTPRNMDGSDSQFTTHGLGILSVDSESSTDVDPDSSDDSNFTFGRYALKSVQELPDGDDYFDEGEEDNGLAGYEDEEESDMTLQSSSSFDSDEDLPRSVAHLQQIVPPHMSPTTRPTQHARRATLSKTWSFPMMKPGQTPSAAPKVEEEKEVDRFFGCLDEIDNDTSGSVPSSPSSYSYEKSKGVFASGLKFAPADGTDSFFGLGIAPHEEPEEMLLTRVAEEAEDSEDGDDVETQESSIANGGVFNGIRITFTPPQEEEVKKEVKQIQFTSPTKRASPPPVLPALDFGFDDEEAEEEVIPFKFSRSLMDERQPSPPPVISVPPIVITPPTNSPSPHSSLPSMIPRASSPSRSSSLADKPAVMTPPLNVFPVQAFDTNSGNSSSFSTPHHKRDGVLPSSIPQPVSSPSPLRFIPISTTTITKHPKAIPTSTFIRQPSRKPLLSNNGKGQNAGGSGANGSALNFQTPVILTSSTIFRSFLRTSRDCSATDGSDQFDSSSPVLMKSIDLSHGLTNSDFLPDSATNSLSSSPKSLSSSQPSFTNPPLSARLSFQALTNFIPLPWVSNSSRAHPTTKSTSGNGSSSSPTFSRWRGTARATNNPAPTPRRSGGYVTREKQLRVLKARMEVEGVVPMTNAVSGIRCHNCKGDFVFI